MDKIISKPIPIPIYDKHKTNGQGRLYEYLKFEIKSQEELDALNEYLSKEFENKYYKFIKAEPVYEKGKHIKTIYGYEVEERQPVLYIGSFPSLQANDSIYIIGNSEEEVESRCKTLEISMYEEFKQNFYIEEMLQSDLKYYANWDVSKGSLIICSSLAAEYQELCNEYSKSEYDDRE